MSNVFGNIEVTQRGSTLLRDTALNTNKNLTSIRMITSSDIVSDPENIGNITVRQTRSYSIFEESTDTIILNVKLDNFDLQNGYVLNTIIFYASDGVGSGEIPFAIIRTENGMAIPPATEYPNIITLNATITLDRNSNVTIAPKFVGFATLEDARSMIDSALRRSIRTEILMIPLAVDEDLNTVISSGFYSIIYSTVNGPKPTGSGTESAILIVAPATSLRIIQIMFYNDGDVWYRGGYRLGNVWRRLYPAQGFYGLCDTSGTVAEKTMVTSTRSGVGFRVFPGAVVRARFSNTNFAENPTLNVSDTGAYPIYYRNEPVPPRYIRRQITHSFVFDGNANRWILTGHAGFLFKDLSNENILHNWDFRNPVNQYGLSIYTGNRYGIDRWRTNSSYTIVTLIPNVGLRIEKVLDQPSSVQTVFSQHIENPQRLSGKQLTISGEFSDMINLTSGIRLWISVLNDDTDVTTYYQTGYLESDGFIVTSLNVANINIRRIILSIVVPTSALNLNYAFTVHRVKLESGPVETLDNDHVMDREKELMVCQRYQRVYSVNTIDTQGMTSPPMRIAPAIRLITGGGENDGRYLYDANM